MSINLKGTLVLAGVGKMGGAMLERIVAIDPKPPQEVLDLLARHHIRHNPPIALITDAEVIIIAVKPQVMDEVLPNLVSLKSSRPLILSVAAGKTIATFAKYFGSDAAIIRTIPNTPAAIGRGITAMNANPNVSKTQMELANALLSSTGEVVTVDDESMIDLVTAVSGSGPAYIFYLTECMAAAGEKIGLPADLAMQLARATVAGSGELMRQSGIDAATLRQNVTSPKGTTYAALQILMADDGMKPLFEKAITAAAKRSKELAS
jgi:pyrroline-5-carboxylate reductase